MSASNLCFLSGRPLISIWTNVHKVRRLWLVTDIHAYIAEFHADIADVSADIAENLADVRNFSQCPQSLCGHLGYGSGPTAELGTLTDLCLTYSLIKHFSTCPWWKLKTKIKLVCL